MEFKSLLHQNIEKSVSVEIKDILDLAREVLSERNKLNTSIEEKESFELFKIDGAVLIIIRVIMFKFDTFRSKKLSKINLFNINVRIRTLTVRFRST